MPVVTSYPGVYVQEVPSSVHTITGVATSIALFIGRAMEGPVDDPVLCQSYTDFDRTFSSDTTYSELAQAVSLFFLNGGTQCYVMRIVNAATAQTAGVTLKNTSGVNVFTVLAISAGTVGNSVRFSVDYNTATPESTFNLSAFTWTTNSLGQLQMANIENWKGLSMNPNSPKYAVNFINQNSSLVNLSIPAAPVPANSYSQSGRPLTADPGFLAAFNAILATGTSFNLSLNGGVTYPIDLSTVAIVTNAATVLGNIQGFINGILPVANPVTVTAVAPALSDGSFLIQIGCATADITITPAATNDIAKALMLGTGQGGIEVSGYSGFRPAPNGVVFDWDHNNTLITFDGLPQNDFTSITVGGTAINLGTSLQTVGPAALMYQDASGNTDGLREKFNIIANAINAVPVSNPAFKWTAQLWGSRLAILPGGNTPDNSIGQVTTAANNIGFGNVPDSFIENVRYYSLGTTGLGNYQTAGVNGIDGNPPAMVDYQTAFNIIDQEVDLFNLLILVRDNDPLATPVQSFYPQASIFCQLRRAILIMEPPDSWTSAAKALDPINGVYGLRIGLVKDYSAIYYPRLTILDTNGFPIQVGPAGAMAGIMARIDASRGVWKAPAGTEADLLGITGLQYRFNDGDSGRLNPAAVNALRIFPDGIVSWGARTMDGDDSTGSQWKYVPVRRTALFIEESLYRGLKWVVFEPNDDRLWAQVRLNVGAFMQDLFTQGAFQGTQKDSAYFVKCDSETTTQNDIDLGIVNIWVGFAPLKPAEFVILYLQQMTGQIQV